MMDEYDVQLNPHKGNKGIMRAWRAAINSWHGLEFAFKEESAFRQELALCAVLIPIAIYLDISHTERILLIASTILILIIELLNSSVEAAIDRISYDQHQLSKRAKDFGSAAVFLTMLVTAITWFSVIQAHFFK